MAEVFNGLLKTPHVVGTYFGNLGIVMERIVIEPELTYLPCPSVLALVGSWVLHGSGTVSLAFHSVADQKKMKWHIPYLCHCMLYSICIAEQLTSNVVFPKDEKLLQVGPCKDDIEKKKLA